MNSAESRTEELIAEADRLEQLGCTQQALACWHKVIDLEPEPISLCRFGRLAAKLGKTAEAEQAFLYASKLAPELVYPYECFGSLKIEQNEPELAKKYLEKALEIEENARTFTMLGIAQLDLSQKDQARESFLAALRIDPSYEEAYYNLGVTFREEQPQKAISLFRKAVELDPEYAIAHRELGWALRALDKYQEAEKHIRRSIDLDESDGWAYIYLSNVAWATRDLMSAEQSLLKATKVWPDDSTSFWCLAIFYEYTERPREADLCYEKALQLNPDDDQANLRFGLYLKQTGDIAKARIYLERTLALDPESERARSALSDLDESKRATVDIRKPH